MSPAKYAARTAVPVLKTRMEIEALLAKHECSEPVVVPVPGLAVVSFIKGRFRVRFQMPLAPVAKDAPEAVRKRVETAHREAWRALLLALKSKFVSVETGIETVEEAFLAHVVMPNNQRVGDLVIPQLADSYARGTMPPLLGSGEGSR